MVVVGDDDDDFDLVGVRSLHLWFLGLDEKVMVGEGYVSGVQREQRGVGVGRGGGGWRR